MFRLTFKRAESPTIPGNRTRRFASHFGFAARIIGEPFNTEVVMSQYRNRKSFSAVSANLKILRGARSQVEFSKFLGIANQVTYHRYENGRVPRAPILQQIATRIGISVDELLSPISSERGVEIRSRSETSGATETTHMAPLSLASRQAFGEASGELVTEKSLKAIQSAFDLKSLTEAEVMHLFDHIVAVSNRAPVELSKYYVLLRVSITKDLERRWRIRVS